MLYSINWSQEKYKPRRHAPIIASNESLKLPSNKVLCAQIVKTPDDNNTIVFSSGNFQNGTVIMPTGGHTAPVWIEGIDAKWIRAQKMLKKNIASETINKINPNFNPCCTLLVWNPCKLSSETFCPHTANNDSTNNINVTDEIGFVQLITKRKGAVKILPKKSNDSSSKKKEGWIITTKSASIPANANENNTGSALDSTIW